MTTKELLYRFCHEFADDRVSRIQSNIKNVQDSLVSETKSSAGDKHETGRAMLQLEREKLGQQLAQAEKMLQVIAKVPAQSNSSIIGLGNLVKTTMGDFFLAISAGEFKSKEQSIFCISVGTPIGKILLGRSADDIIVFNGKSIRIVAVI